MTCQDTPLVAIVTPVFNGEEFLAAAMESVQALDYPNLIHVVLDNGSSDSTPAIIERYRHRRVPLLTSRRAATVPMGANWNAAVGMVPPEARYFRILCADDTLYHDAIARPVAVAERDPDIGLVGCLWRADGLCGEELQADREIFDGKEIMRSYLRREHTALSGMHVLVRRSGLDAHRPFYDESLPSFDSEANLRICLRSKYGFVRAELGTWRIHANSTTSQTASRTLAHEICWLTLLDRYGSQVLGFRGYVACRIAYRRHLLRRMLKARIRSGNARAFALCLERLQQVGDPASPMDFADALLDWTMLALTRRRHRVGMPRQQTGLQDRAAAVAHIPEF